ncbi:hypothetical protein F2P81_025160 [Scophthalmus maximus]|uniref:Complex 1 LYR protein domain-containing protein n=1 Tax=Scophthalmus maximus TaxID=52904 RepID=A0A6A4RVJ6_SCOMX|nr:hypothetical protein F2P81_025160 [Scophthalmus maximus]
MSRHSKLQKQVLALYRHFLRAGRDKPGFVPRIRDEFRENACIKRTDVMYIEYLYRRGQRQLEQLRDVNTKQLGSFSRDQDQMALLRWLSSQSEEDRGLLAAVTGLQVGRELLNRITGQDKVDTYKNPGASQADLNTEVQKRVVLFAARVRALEAAAP